MQWELNAVEVHIRKLGTQYSLEIGDERDGYIVKDYNINGTDSIHFMEDIEAAFSLDLKPLLEKVSYKNYTFFGKTIYTKTYRVIPDMKVSELAKIVFGNI